MADLLTTGQIIDLWVRKCETHKAEDIRPYFDEKNASVNISAGVKAYDGPILPDGWGTQKDTDIVLKFFVAPNAYACYRAIGGADLYPECKQVTLKVDNTTPHLTEQQAIELFDKELQPVIAWVKSLPVNR